MYHTDDILKARRLLQNVQVPPARDNAVDNSWTLLNVPVSGPPAVPQTTYPAPPPAQYPPGNGGPQNVPVTGPPPVIYPPSSKLIFNANFF